MSRKFIAVDLTDKEHDRLKEWCREQGRSIGQQVRLMILKLTKRKESSK